MINVASVLKRQAQLLLYIYTFEYLCFYKIQDTVEFKKSFMELFWSIYRLISSLVLHIIFGDFIAYLTCIALQFNFLL